MCTVQPLNMLTQHKKRKGTATYNWASGAFKLTDWEANADGDVSVKSIHNSYPLVHPKYTTVFHEHSKIISILCLLG